METRIFVRPLVPVPSVAPRHSTGRRMSMIGSFSEVVFGCGMTQSR